MPEPIAERLIELSLERGAPAELDEFARRLRSELEELNVDSVEQVSAAGAPAGTKAVDLAAVGQMAITLAPAIVPPLFYLLSSRVERKPSTPVKVRAKVGKRTAQIAYDPTKTSAKDLEGLIKALNKSIKTKSS
jgi:hypothetical protein